MYNISSMLTIVAIAYAKKMVGKGSKREKRKKVVKFSHVLNRKWPTEI